MSICHEIDCSDLVEKAGVWNPTIIDAASIWTDDPTAITGLSDKPIIEGLLREREVASICGAAKTSKTWIALELSLAVAEGRDFLGRPTHQKKVLYLDYELKPQTLQKRICMLAGNRPKDFMFICLRGQKHLPTPQEISELVKKHGIGLVVVDSLYRTGWQREENNNDTAAVDLTPLQYFATDTGASMLVIDHTGKGGGEGRSAVDASRGASAKGGFFDALMVLRSTDKGEDPEGSYVLLDAVLRDWPSLKKLPLVSFIWSSTSCRIEAVGEVDPQENKNAGVILDILVAHGDWMKTADLADRAFAAAEIKDTTLRTNLRGLKKAGRVESQPDPNHKQALLWRIKQGRAASLPYRDNE